MLRPKTAGFRHEPPATEREIPVIDAKVESINYGMQNISFAVWLLHQAPASNAHLPYRSLNQGQDDW